MRILLAGLTLLIALAFLPAERAHADEAAARAVIEGQIEAFLADDGPAAYSFAAPGIRSMFPNEERFKAMVRQGYPPVYRPRDFAFGRYRETAAGPVQEVSIVDRSGVAWQAIYSLEQQPDGTWKISGCRLVRLPGVSA
ncbi:DUF4864 domain-containing protein [Salinarimonas ramus]|uniref:DUF4864 domain-containing protein n=1 Tax=Salinarimonas ramus TaxID=690164 RepID=A0A917V7M9_9HYPH|nr:DUF4864 domain-containing protein [Salinarimonas ramus]GGK48086.1 DUF4864 domain-containing protein [Salinarimonas ramus]